ncbi:drug/metabolite transporter (DMT)-like permease [Breoghania corrubedonensis]|uniref:Drug/metabolite transporter (DMT)-like permease n=1 Tax=Breoghania corrubedonensis TaxID=665038 RepID=A0A2T5VE45_9HYPH|nr:DMT family transporter [Breoghania corrubedonensis]PTW62029.1 drug/metabolite transporter (DMT)-like permease [Breoghania corrubedonensis]
MRHLLIYFELVCSALFWGLTFNAAHLTVSSLPPLTTAAMRFGIAAVLMAVLLLFMQKGWTATLARNFWAFLGMAIAGVVGFNAFFFFGMQFTSPTNGALIMATNPLVTALIARIFLGEPISRNHKVGTTISFIGVAALIMFGSRGGMTEANVGDLLIIGGNVSMALYGIINKRWVKQSTPLTTTGITTIMGGLILLVLAVWREPGAMTLQLSWEIWAALIFMGACGSVLAYIFWNRGFHAIGVADTALFFHLVPVFAVLGSFAFGQEVTVEQIIAGVVVITGVMISSGALKKFWSVLSGPSVEVPAATEAEVSRATE